MPPEGKKPALVLTGFLGAGKTTLLNKIMAAHPELKLALIINEFGDIGLDASLIKTPGEFVEMNNGCLCCALNEDLVLTLENLKKRDDYDALILETSGIADPLTVAWTFLRPQFTDFFALHGIITVADPYLLESQKGNALLEEQIRSANLLFVSKGEDLDARRRQAAESSLRALNAKAPLKWAPDLSWAKPLLLKDSDLIPHLGEPANKTPHDYESLSVNLGSNEITLELMEDLFDAFPDTVFRAKAIFRDPQRKRYFVLHSVCGRLSFEELSAPPSQTAIVIIGNGILNNQELAAILKPFQPSSH